MVAQCKLLMRLLLLAILLYENRAEIPNCDYLDTVDLTDSIQYANGSYLYENVLIPRHLIGEYDYELRYGGEKFERSKHIRGCVCKLKSCVRFCCHPSSRIDFETGECAHEFEKEIRYDPIVDITFNNLSALPTNVLKEFAVQQGLPCNNPLPLNAETSEYDQWKLFENGTLLVFFSMNYVPKGDFCLQATEEKGRYTLKPHYCPVIQQVSIKTQIVTYVMTTSVICLVLAILVYLILPSLQTHQGQCLISYLIALTVGYFDLVIQYYVEVDNFRLCQFIGYSGYFGFIAAFLWLTVINYDLWNSFRGMNYNVRENRTISRFGVYNLYAWGTAVVLTILIILIDLTDLSWEWKPSVTLYTCWINTYESMSALFYFYGPMLLMIIYNLIMFILSVRKISQIKRELERVDIKVERLQRLTMYQQNFWIYVRLFFVMGITWLFEIFSFLAEGNKFLTHIFSVADLLNAAQGIIIFVLFILRPKIKRALLKRIGRLDADDSDKTNEGISMQERFGATHVY